MELLMTFVGMVMMITMILMMTTMLMYFYQVFPLRCHCLVISTVDELSLVTLKPPVMYPLLFSLSKTDSILKLQGKLNYSTVVKASQPKLISGHFNACSSSSPFLFPSLSSLS